jgi:hypothetical protein
VPLEFIIRAEMWTVNAQLHCSNGKLQLQSSHNQAVYVRRINENFIAVAYIWLKMISGRLLSLTNKGV